jgi:hypothetical protein
MGTDGTFPRPQGCGKPISPNKNLGELGSSFMATSDRTKARTPRITPRKRRSHPQLTPKTSRRQFAYIFPLPAHTIPISLQ